jgi:uncharacterized membrane protein YbhN (UPF0104 family)
MAGSVWIRYAKLALKSAVAVVVLWAVGRHVVRTWHELQTHPGVLRFDPAWLVVAGLLYLAGLTPCGVYFGRIMGASPSPIGMYAAVRAYLIGHLGKYVPGKAMTVVMRVGLVIPHGGGPASATIATFYETFVMMASGALVAALGFAADPETVQVEPLSLAVGLLVLFLFVVDPLVFPRVVSFLTKPFPDIGAGAHPAITRGLLGEGLLLSGAGWVLLGLSQVAVIRALTPAGVDVAYWPLVTASVALATVAGFVVAVMPGGIGVREGVLMWSLAPALKSNELAVVAALALRLIWVLAEVAAAAVLMVVRPAIPPAASSEQPDATTDPEPEAEPEPGTTPP